MIQSCSLPRQEAHNMTISILRLPSLKALMGAVTQYHMLSAKATRLLIDICSQLRFQGDGGTKNNGDLCAAFSVMKERGWTSHESLEFALKELLYYGFIKITRRGERKKCHLYAVTWWAIDDCDRKLDVAETNVPSNEWKAEKSKWKRPQRK